MAKALLVKRAPVLALPRYEIADVAALRAINAGTASQEQQVRFSAWLFRDVCSIGGLSFEDGNDGATAFNEGKRAVAIFLQFFINEPMDNLRNRLKKPPTTDRGE